MTFSLRPARHVRVLGKALFVLQLAFVANAAGVNSSEDIQNSLKTFTKVYQLVEANFADEVKSEKALYGGAIPGMLRTLDPHSSFYDPKELQRFRENQRGQYFGVGMYVGWRNGHVTVSYPFAGSPARKAGLRPGDMIFRVNGKNTEKSGVDDVVDLLKGPRGTPVQLGIKREGNTELIIFDLVRDQVDRPTVPTAIWAKNGTAYVRIDSFNEKDRKSVV